MKEKKMQNTMNNKKQITEDVVTENFKEIG
jgi:hypothetical protein